jgi:hypothetical protein
VYDYRPEAETREAEALEFFHPRDWLRIEGSSDPGSADFEH